MLVEPSLRLLLLFRRQKRTELGARLLAQIPKRGVTHLLGSMALNSADGFYGTVVLFLSNGYHVSQFNTPLLVST